MSESRRDCNVIIAMVAQDVQRRPSPPTHSPLLLCRGSIPWRAPLSLIAVYNIVTIVVYNAHVVKSEDPTTGAAIRLLPGVHPLVQV